MEMVQTVTMDFQDRVDFGSMDVEVGAFSFCCLGQW
jgi:hypothetical protein